ncbi:Dihydrolipoyl dehydrogenase [Oligella ureolytica]|uniref:Dihydrolipoyl dehydrogenase n=1 Tax=Oligella ureolytica TaxID=90244 RepID=A0A378XFX8_9BURK|nr:dihydrolipoyl dehydrogenase [Oligella ureolytica]QPT39341.1 dihydrolipoyl dehydrogenase [Oligella ureolytica]SUA55711.1 Dihydrolipoyl dehydrogenase [Oligella ureolytica]
MKTRQVDVAIIGAGTAGLYALREVKRAKKSFVLIDRGPLGTTCARVGCMPSKVALHAAELWSMREEQKRYGISGTEKLVIDRTATWAKVRSMRDGFAGGAADNAIKSAGEHLLMGEASFLEPTVLQVEDKDGLQRIEAKAVVIAVGSRPVVPSILTSFSDYLITTDQLFELEKLPERLGLLGLGAIGLEMGLAMQRLGVEVVGADMAETIGGIRDPEVAKYAQQAFAEDLPMFLGEPARLEAAEQGVQLVSGDNKVRVDKVLVALGRRPNIDQLNLAEAGFKLDEHGMPKFNLNTLQIEDYPVYLVGDANAHRTLMHEASAEGAIAGFNACREVAQAFERKTSLAIAFTQPDIISVGAGFNDLNEDEVLIGTAYSKSDGRSRILSSKEGVLRIYADKKDGKLLGAAMVGARAEHIAQFLALAISQKMTARELLATPFYHPVVEELVQSAVQNIVRAMPESPYPFGLTAIN